MIIRRAPCKSNYTVIPNAILQDTTLSLEALGLLCSLLSRPANWEVSSELIEAERGVGRDKLRRMFRELRKAGYARLMPSRHTKTGALNGRGYEISDVPFSTPDCAEPVEDTTNAATDRPTENTSFGKTERLEIRPSEKPTDGKHVVHIQKKEDRKNNIYPQNARARLDAGAVRQSPVRLASPQIWIARHSPEGEAWEAYRRRRGEKVPWMELRGHTTDGWHFPARWPPRADNLPAPGMTFVARAASNG